jgi:uncharacterized protein (TIRG00374 family)
MDSVARPRAAPSPPSTAASSTVPTVARTASTPPARLSRRIVLHVVALLATAIGLYFVWPKLLEVFSQWPQLTQIHWWWFVVMIAAEVASLVSLWALLRLTLHVPGWFRVSAPQLAGNAFSRIVPGGAAAGGALQYDMLRWSGLDGAQVATGLATASLIGTATLTALPVLALPAMLAGVPIARGLRTAALLGLGVFVVMVLAGALLLTLDGPLRFAARCLQRVRNAVFRRRPPITNLPDRLITARDLLRHVLGRSWHKAILAAAGNWLLDFLALMAAVAATGARPRPSLVLLAYVVAAVLGMIPITPGGLGFVEAGLASTLVLAGVPSGQAALATLAYRLVSYWLPLPAGVIAYGLHRRRYAGRRGQAPAEPDPPISSEMSVTSDGSGVSTDTGTPKS